MSERSPSAVGDSPASISLDRLQSVWFQVTGLLCNLECTHCLVDSSPRNKTMKFLTREEIRNQLEDCRRLGVKEIYFTGGEPFLHREMTTIVADTLEFFPTTVLTNGTLITPRLARELGEIAETAAYSLEIRISMDHPVPETNDAVRGKGVHAKALRAVLRLQEAGLLPIVTATEYLLTCGSAGSLYERFLEVLKSAGVQRPRLKVLPVFHTGKLDDPRSGKPVTRSMVEASGPAVLQCSETRVVTASGVYACPILVGHPGGRVGNSIPEAVASPVTLEHHACMTCYETGMSCGNF